MLACGKEAVHILPENWEREAPEAVTEAFLAFSAPLLRALPEDHNAEDVRGILLLSSACWNLPALEHADPVRYRALRRLLDECVTAAPVEIRGALAALGRDRIVYFGWMPFAVRLEITGSDLESLEIRAVPERTAAPAARPLPPAAVSGAHPIVLPGVPGDVKIRIA